MCVRTLQAIMQGEVRRRVKKCMHVMHRLSLCLPFFPEALTRVHQIQTIDVYT